MIAIVTILSAFPLGFFLSSRLAANTTYAIAYLWAFVFQGIYLMLDMLDGGKNPAFEPDTFPISYGIVALTIFAVGFGLVQLGHRVGRGRRERRQASSRSSLTGTRVSAASGNTAASANVAG
ncbi:MAG: hypothetical protein QOD98_648 [Nocardioidaceae bacterium]|jgi:hypothetical protein|nr:hypothetical protein [Nocardioidaceae bacterium]